MSTYPVISIIDGQRTFEKPLDLILGELKAGGALRILDPIEYHTYRQTCWYKGICLQQLVKADENGETEDWWDTEVKAKCKGLAYLKKEGIVVELKLGDEIQRVSIGRLTTKGVGKRNMTNFIEEILSQAITRGWPVSEPDAALRRKE